MAKPSKPQEIDTQPDVEFFIPSLNGVAKFMGRSKSTVSGWVGKGMPGTPGRWPAGAIVRWMLETIVPRTAVLNPESKESLTKDKLRLSNEKARLMNGRLRGTLVPRDAALVEMELMLATAAARVAALPEEMGIEIEADRRPEIVSLWQDKIILCLKEMASWALEGVDPPHLDRAREIAHAAMQEARGEAPAGTTAKVAKKDAPAATDDEW